MPGTEPARTKPNILVVDDDIYLLAAIQQTLLLNGYLADVCNAPLEAMERIGPATSHAAVIADVKMPRMNGIDLQVCIREMDPDLPVILITGHGDVAMAVKAMKAGAYDFLEKPVDEDALLASLARAVEKRHLVEENRKLAGRLRHEREERLCFHGLVGSHPLMRRLHEILDVVAAEEAPVLISGETGTGKEVVARAVHALSTRAEDPFVAVNMGAIPGEMLEAELFGFDKGAFTGATQAKAGKFELAGKGSLFLDEICSLPPGLQGKLLRVLEERSITRLGSNTAIPLKSRIIAATNKDLGQEIQRGSFRSDLYFRLNVLPIDAAPARTPFRHPAVDRLFPRTVRSGTQAGPARLHPGTHRRAVSARLAGQYPRTAQRGPASVHLRSRRAGRQGNTKRNGHDGGHRRGHGAKLPPPEGTPGRHGTQLPGTGTPRPPRPHRPQPPGPGHHPQMPLRQNQPPRTGSSLVPHRGGPGRTAGYHALNAAPIPGS